MWGWRGWAVAIVVLSVGGRIHGAGAEGAHVSVDDPQSVEEGEPVQVEDAFTDAPGLLSLQYSQIYTDQRGRFRQQLFSGGPTFKLGALPGVQISFNPTYQIGLGNNAHQGTATTDAMIQLNRQGRFLPAFAVDVFWGAPYGAGDPSTAYTVRLLASKYLGPGQDSPRLHVNLTDYHLTRAGGDQRRDQLELTVGASVQLGEETALVADVVHGAEEEPGASETSVEFGVLRDLPDDWNVTLGAGRQVEGRGGTWRVLFSFEKELTLF